MKGRSALVVALLIFGGAACSESTAGDGEGKTPPDGASADVEIQSSPELTAFWQGEGRPLAVLSDRADELPEQLRRDEAAGCATVAGELTGIATPTELLELAEQSPNAAFGSVVSNYEAALSSAFAACRGDAPIPLEVALDELIEESQILAAAIEEAGLS